MLPALHKAKGTATLLPQEWLRISIMGQTIGDPRCLVKGEIWDRVKSLGGEEKGDMVCATYVDPSGKVEEISISVSVS